MILADFNFNFTQFHFLIVVLFISFLKYIIEKFRERFGSDSFNEPERESKEDFYSKTSSNQGYTKEKTKPALDKYNQRINKFLDSMGIEIEDETPQKKPKKLEKKKKKLDIDHSKLQKSPQVLRENKEEQYDHFHKDHKSNQKSNIKEIDIDSPYRINNNKSINRYKVLKTKLKSNESLKTAFLLKEVLDTPKGLL